MDSKEHITDRLGALELEVLYYIHKTGPVFITKLAKRLNREPGEVKATVDGLRDNDLLERVTSTLVDYRLNKRSKVTKHRNHTYFDLTRKARQALRRTDLDLDVNLRPPYLQA